MGRSRTRTDDPTELCVQCFLDVAVSSVQSAFDLILGLYITGGSLREHAPVHDVFAQLDGYARRVAEPPVATAFRPCERDGRSLPPKL